MTTVGERSLPALVLAAALVLGGLVLAWFALLAQFAGPVVDDGLQPQFVAGLAYGGLAALSVVLAVLVVRRGTIG